GQGGTLAANASGASTIDLEAFPTTSANATASGASNVTVNTTGRLDADASGASNIHYLGQPALGDIEESGGSNVEQR
ncbi:GIN domain-containing protein, partial [Promineifilum sp.]|uniref:GIN domain-containing protein n=1 Tax=Promineifilum sp. TaxID=2664178 RepID=UPI0035B49309